MDVELVKQSSHHESHYGSYKSDDSEHPKENEQHRNCVNKHNKRKSFLWFGCTLIFIIISVIFVIIYTRPSQPTSVTNSGSFTGTSEISFESMNTASSLNSFNSPIPQSAFDSLSDAFDISGCGSTVVSSYDGTDALFDATKTTQKAFDLVSALGVIYIQCDDDIQIAQQWVINNYDPTKISLRSGGNSFGGYNKANDAIVFDLSNLNDITVISNEYVSVGPGVTLQEWITYISDNEGVFDRSVPHGTCPTIAFGGLTLGGGIGLNMREYGLLIDYLVGFDIILCDNTKLTIMDEQYDGQNGLPSTTIGVTNEQRDDLLFAIRGSGGSNIGIISKLYFTTFEIDANPTLYFSLHYPVNDTVDLISNTLKTWRDIFASPLVTNNIDIYIHIRVITEQFPINLEQYPKGYIVDVQGVYKGTSPTDDLQAGYDIISRFETNVGTNYDPTDSILPSSTVTYAEYNQHILDEYAPVPDNGVTSDGRYPLIFTSRFVDSYVTLDDVWIDAFSDRVYADILKKNEIYLKALETFDLEEIQPFTMIFEPMGGAVTANGIDNDKVCNTNSAFTGRDVAANVIMLFGWISESAMVTANNEREQYEEQYLNQLSNKKYINYIDDIVTDYDQLYFDECIFNQLIEIRNEYNPQQCFDYRWSIPTDNPYDDDDGDFECPSELTTDDKAEIEQIIAGNKLFIDAFFNEKDPDNNYVDLLTFVDDFYADNSQTINIGFPSDFMLVNKDSFINWALDTNELIEAQHSFPTLLYFDEFTSTESSVDEYNGCINTVRVRQTTNAQVKYTGQSNPSLWNNIVVEFTAEFIRRSSDNDNRWKTLKNELEVSHNGVIPSEEDLIPITPTTTMEREMLECYGMNDTYREDIIAEMIAKGYEVEFGEINFDFVDDSGAELTTFRIPFVNADSDYGASTYYSNGLPASRLSGQDIILFRGCTPPLVTYYSYRSYLSTTTLGLNDDGTFFDLVFKQSSLGDSLNNLIIKTEETNNGCSDNGCSPFNNNVFDVLTNIATTGDEQSFNDLKDVYNVIGLDPDSLNLDSIPIEANFKWSESADTFPRDTVTLLFRLVNNGNVRDEREELVSLYQNETQPIYIFRKLGVTDPRIPIPANLRETRVPYLKSEDTFLNRILFANAIKATKEYFIFRKGYKLLSDTQFIQNRGSVPNPLGGDPLNVYIFEHGLWCLDNEVDCILDNRDTHYSWDATSYTLNDDDLYIIVGLNHNNFDMSIYNSFGIYYVIDPIQPLFPFTPLQEPDGSIIDDEYEQFDINDVIQTDNIENTFIASVSRPINCLSDCMASLCPDKDKLNEEQPFVFLARAHLNPQTATMPNERQLIPWRLLRFRI